MKAFQLTSAILTTVFGFTYSVRCLMHNYEFNDKIFYALMFALIGVAGVYLLKVTYQESKGAEEQTDGNNDNP